MLTIEITKAGLKNAFFGGTPDYSQQYSAAEEPQENMDVILLKIMLDNYNPKEAA